MDDRKLKDLIARMGRSTTYNGGFAPDVLPLVTVEQYYDGAEGEAGLFCNTELAPSDDEAVGILQQLRARDDVSDVRVAITNCDDDEWPFSDKIVVITTMAADLVGEILPDGLQPDEVWEGDAADMPAEDIPVPPGHRKVWLWYD